MRYLILIMSCIGFHYSLLSQESSIQKLCENITIKDCQDCQNFLKEGWSYHQKKQYGDAIHQYTLAFGPRYVPANDLINQLIKKSDKALYDLRQETIKGAMALEELHRQLIRSDQLLEGKNETISTQKDSIQAALRLVHKKGQKAESFRIPSLANNVRRTANCKDALYLAFYSILLQKKEDIISPSIEALMEAGAIYDDFSPIIFSTKEKIETMQALEDGQLLIATNQHVFIHEQKENKRLDTQVEPPFQITFSHDKKKMALTGQKGQVELWDIEKKQFIKRFKAHEKAIQFCQFSADGHFLVTANRSGTAFIYPLNTTELLIKIQNRENLRIYDLKISPTHHQIFTRHPKGIIKIWNQNGEEINTLGEQEIHIHDAQFLPNQGQFILTSNTFGQIKQWDIHTGNVQRKAKESIPIKKIYTLYTNAYLYHTTKKLVINQNKLSLEYTFEDRILGVKINQTKEKALVWTVQGGLFQINLLEKSKMIYPRQRKNVLDAQFSADGNLVTSSSKDGYIKMWDKQAQVVLSWQLNESTPVVPPFSEDRKYLFLIGSDGTNIRQVPLPKMMKEKLQQQKKQVLQYLKSKKSEYGLQYIEML